MLEDTNLPDAAQMILLGCLNYKQGHKINAINKYLKSKS